MLEAKDTVMSWERIRMVLQEQDKKGQRDPMFRLEAIAEAQAEITLKAVEEQESTKAYNAGLYDGMVKWLELNLIPKHWYGAGWGNLIEKGITDYLERKIW